MASFTNGPTKSYLATGAIGVYLRVKKNAGTVEVAGVADASIGVTTANVATGEPVTIQLKSATGSYFYTASKAIAINAPVYGAAAGKITDAVGGEFLGFAEIAAGSDGDVIEVLSVSGVVPAPTAAAAQAVATDLATTTALANQLRTALIAVGIIKGAA